MKVYDRETERLLNELKHNLASCSKSNFSLQYTVCDKLYREYKDYKFDSAYVYSQKLLRISNLTNDPTKQYESKIKLGSIQLSLDMFKETFEAN